MWLGTTNQSALFHHTKVIFMTQDSRTNYFLMKGLAVRYGNNLRHSNLLNCAKRFGKNWSKCGFQNILIGAIHLGRVVNYHFLQLLCV